MAGRRGRGWLALIVALIAAGAVLLAACTPPGLPPPERPESARTTTATAAPSGQITIGLDGAVRGFNPHLIADYSPVEQAVAALVLPSASVVRPDGVRAFDPAVVSSAGVTAEKPFTVTYKLNPQATWSDGTPITADDFIYLWQQMSTEPGTIAPAGYREISDVISRDAGKTVLVEFSSRAADWEDLFSGLLPAHIARDAPGGWATFLSDGIPVSGNKYKMRGYDSVAGEVTLVRNDKYWGAQPGPATVVLRVGVAAELIAGFRRGDLQALLVHPSGSQLADLDAFVPASRRVSVPAPATVQLIFNTASGPTADPNVRRALAAGLVPGLLASTLTGAWSAGAATVTSQVTLPSGTSATEAAGSPPIRTGDQQAAVADLTAAGYHRDGLYFSKDGAPLQIVVGYPADAPRLAAAAAQIQAELGSVGIVVDLMADSSADLVTRMTAGKLDVGLVELPRDPSDAIAAGSAFGCPAAATDVAPPTDGGPAATNRLGNLSGYCEAGVAADLADALSGGATLAAADTVIWADLPVYPLVQRSAVFAVAPSLASVAEQAGPGWVWTGPLAGLALWPAPPGPSRTTAARTGG